MNIQKAFVILMNKEIKHKEYARAITLDFVHNPVAYALYKVWRKADRERKTDA